jgi:hypothetical protein
VTKYCDSSRTLCEYYLAAKYSFPMSCISEAWWVGSSHESHQLARCIESPFLCDKKEGKCTPPDELIFSHHYEQGCAKVI